MTYCLRPWTAAVLAALASAGAHAAGDPIRGARVFGACASCHSIEPGEQMTGPSLARIWNRSAGSVAGFERYSDALKRSGVVWTEANLDKWLAGPGKFIPGTGMSFPGLPARRDREDVAAFLRAASEGKAPNLSGSSGGAMMTGRKRPNLRQAPPEGQVTSIEYCHDTYTLRTAAGTTDKVWEYNLRLKTDSSRYGPAPGKPVIIGAGMQGDRASVVFASPEEIGSFIKQCR